MKRATLRTDAPLSQALNRKDRGDNIRECLTCGICNSRCTWYDGEGGPNPRQMVRLAQLGLDDLLAESPMLWDCMACNHCTVGCPVGIQMADVVRRARALPQAGENVPRDLAAGVRSRLETGDVNGFTREDFFETIEWINEELEDEADDGGVRIPVDVRGARYLYLPNPRELGSNILHLQAMAGLFHAFDRPWTMSSRHTDVTNWGYFLGDERTMRAMALQVVEAAEDLEIGTLVLSECGHAYIVYKKLLTDLIGRPPAFDVLSLPELTLEMADKGAIRLDPDRFPDPIAYHDPCNIGRKAGQFEAPRRLLAHLCRQPRELAPNRMQAICCGGGGGLLQDSTSKDRRTVAGKAKADQMRAAGVRQVATSCLSCHRQLGELAKHFGLEIRVDTVVSLAAEALVR